MSAATWYHLRDEWHELVCCVPGCKKPMGDHHPMPVCNDCGWMIANHYRSSIVHQTDLERQKQDATREAAKPPEERWEGWHVVYYVRIGDYIKIGTTKRLKQRLSQLRVSKSALLAIEEGDRLLEARRHREFQADRIDTRRENFRPSDQLKAHIAATREGNGLPHWATRPATSQITIRQREQV